MAAVIDRELYLMSPPGPRWALRGRANFRSAVADPVDADAARREWNALARAITDAGGEVLAVPPQDDLTGLPYCAEAGHPVINGDEIVFLLPRMQSPHRRGEANVWKGVAASLGFQVVEPAHGVWEGQGDVASFLGETLLFYGGRTDTRGLAEVRRYFPRSALEIEVILPAFHGNVAVLPIDACERLVVCPELLRGDSLLRLRSRFGDHRLVEISADEARCYSTNALPINTTLLAPTVIPRRIIDILGEAGMDVVELGMRELCEKAGGASRCLVCRVPREIAAKLTIPPSMNIGAPAADGSHP